MKYVRVAHSEPIFELFVDERARTIRWLNPTHVGPDENNIVRKAEFFIVHRDADIDFVVEALAKANPGKEVQVLDVKSISWCPAAEMQTKEVGPDGVLPKIKV